MLNSLRRFASTWFGKFLGALLLVGLAGFGISNVITNIGSNTVARVGGEDITTRDFQRAYDRQINAAAQQFGTIPTAEQALALGIPSAAINQLATDAAINGLARELGLGVSDQRLAGMLRSDPSFGDTLGNFNASSFQQILRQNGYTENEYFEAQKKASERQQIAVAVFGGTYVPTAAETLINRYGADTRTIDYFTLDSQSLPPVAEPTEEEMAAYLKDKQADYRTEPARTVALMVLSPEAIASGIEVGDEEIAAEYERTKASYATAETRTIRQVVLKDDAQKQVFEDGLKAGKSFDELIGDPGLTVTDLGTLARSGIADATLADAAFELTSGGYALVPGALGTRVVNVSVINPAAQKSLAEIQDQIAGDLKLKGAKAEYVEILDQIEELRAAFRPIAEIASRYNLEVEEVTLAQSGDALSSVAAIPEEGRARVATAVFAANVGDLAPAVALGATLNVWFDLKQDDPARDQTLDEVRDQVHQAMVDARTDEALKAEAEKAIADLKAGKAFGDLAAASNQFPQLSQPFKRGGTGIDALGQAVAGAAFGGGTGYSGYARNADGNYVVFQVADVTPAGAGTASDKDFVRNAVIDSLYSDFAAALREDSGLNINEAVLSQLLGLDGSR